jgi:alpha-1,2-mannosyltransferase
MRQLLGAAVALLAAVAALQVWQAWDELNTSGMDLQQDYIAAQRMRHNDDLYRPFTAQEIASLGVREELGVGMRENAHPPPAVALFVPLTWLPYPAVTLGWTLASVGLLWLGTVRLIQTLALPVDGLWRWLGLCLLVSWYPVWQHLHVGQWTIPLFALIVAAWLCLRTGRDGWAGVLIGLAILFKIYPVLLLGYLLLARRWRAVLAALAVCLIVVLLQTLIYPDQWPRYLSYGAPHNAAVWVPNSRNASLMSLGYRLFTGSNEVRPMLPLPWAEPLMRGAVCAAVLGSFAWMIWRLRQQPDLDGTVSLAICLMALLSPISWNHAFIFMLLPLGYVWQQVRTHLGAWRRAPAVLAITALLLSLVPIEVIFVNLKRAYQPELMPPWVGLLIPATAGMACVYLAVWLTLRRRLAAPMTNPSEMDSP